jgi:hypothetical protein
MSKIFVIEPPWAKRKGGLRKSRPNQSRNFGYETMSTSDIFCYQMIEDLYLGFPKMGVFSRGKTYRMEAIWKSV